MNQSKDDQQWPEQAGNPRDLAELQPPIELEDSVVDALNERGLLQPPTTDNWRTLRFGMALAASLALVAIGYWLGQSSAGAPGSLTGAETNLYALLLYETPQYDRAEGAEARQRYSEYGQWVAEAISRDQFVTGEDLEVEKGWRIVPGQTDWPVQSDAAAPEAAPLSGIFFIRADGPDEALALAKELPHLRHGGTVVVQKTIPTNVPPAG